MANDLDQELRFFFKSAGQGSASLNVVRLEGSEAISQLFRFELILVSNSAEIDFKDMLSNSAMLTIRSHEGSQEFPYHGELAEFEQLNKVNEFVFYRAVMVPKVSRLSLNQINEVYLNEKSIPEVIEQVLKIDMTNNDFEMVLKHKSAYRKRSFICQHQESNLNFISRWMEFEGMYYFFEHGDADSGTDKLKILDYKQGHPNQSISLKYCQAEDLQTQFQDQNVTGFICRQRPLPKTVIVQDFNYRQANLENLKATETVSDTGRGEVMFYGDNLRTNEEAKALAKVRAQELQSRGQIFLGDATAVGLRSGYFLELTEHYRDSFNAKYLITEVQHFGSQAGVLLAGAATPYSTDDAVTNYRASFIAIPAETQFRPERVTPKPVIAGTMSGVVDSEGSGDYAEINEYGQYKVQLLYDLSEKKDNKGSAWIRMASPYAGSRNGMNFPLLKGAEVLLSFLGGDPDQPVIMAAVPNSENPNVVTSDNLYSSGLMTPSGNKLTFSDEPGHSGYQIYVPGVGVTGYTGGAGSPKSKLQSLSAGAGEDPVEVDLPAAAGYRYADGYDISVSKGGSSKVTLALDAEGKASMSNKLSLGIANETKVAFDASFNFGLKLSYSGAGDYKLPYPKGIAEGHFYKSGLSNKYEKAGHFLRLGAGVLLPTTPVAIAGHAAETTFAVLTFVAAMINTGLLGVSLKKVHDLAKNFGQAHKGVKNPDRVTGLANDASLTFSKNDYIKIAECSSFALSAASFLYLFVYKSLQPASTPVVQHITEDQFIAGSSSLMMGSSSIVLEGKKVRIRSSPLALEVPYNKGDALVKHQDPTGVLTSEISLSASKASFQVPELDFHGPLGPMYFNVFTNLKISPTLAYLGLSVGQGISIETLNTSISNTTIDATALERIRLVAGTNSVNITKTGVSIVGPQIQMAGVKITIGGIEMVQNAYLKMGEITALFPADNPAAYASMMAENAAALAADIATKAALAAASAARAAEIGVVKQLDSQLGIVQDAVIGAKNTVDSVLGKHSA